MLHLALRELASTDLHYIIELSQQTCVQSEVSQCILQVLTPYRSNSLTKAFHLECCKPSVNWVRAASYMCMHTARQACSAHQMRNGCQDYRKSAPDSAACWYCFNSTQGHQCSWLHLQAPAPGPTFCDIL